MNKNIDYSQGLGSLVSKLSGTFLSIVIGALCAIVDMASLDASTFSSMASLDGSFVGIITYFCFVLEKFDVLVRY